MPKKEKTQPAPATIKYRGLLGWVLAVALIGLAVSAYLSVLHWQVHYQPGHVSFCAMGEAVNCDTVALSQHSQILGMPIATWGIIFYLLLATLAFWGIRAFAGAWPWGLVYWMGAGAAGFSVYLCLVAEVLIGSFCIMCACLYLVNLATVILGIWGQKWRGVPVLTSSAVVCLAAALGSLSLLLLVRENPLVPLVMAAAFGVAAIVLGLLRQFRGISLLFRNLFEDLGAFIRRPVVGFVFAAAGAVLVVLAFWVTHKLYPDRVIAGGLEGISTGRLADGRNWIGAAQPEVEIVEYSDYECPFCGRAHEMVRNLVRQRKEWLRLVHVHMPLDQSCNRSLSQPFHQFSCLCARAAICADRQDRFWEMNDLLFARRCGLDASGLAVVAEKIGLNVPRFKECLGAAETEQALQSDLEAIRRQGLKPATPTFMVGDQLVVGGKDPEWWEQTLTRLRQKAKPPAAPSPAVNEPALDGPNQPKN